MSTDAPVDPNTTQLYINNLNFTTTQQELAAFIDAKIAPAKATEVNIVTRRGKAEGRSRGFGFVRVPNDKVNAALTLNGAQLAEREVGVVVANPKTERPPREPKAPREKKPKEPKAPKAPKAPKEPKAAAAPKQPRARKPAPERKVHENATQLYVNNLHFEVTVDELSNFFESKTGHKPVEVDIVTSKFGRFKGRSRGFGFVTVPNAAVDASVKLAGQSLKERELGIVVAREREAQAEEAAPAETAAPAAEKAKKPRKPRAPKAAAAATGAAAAVTPAAPKAEGEAKPKKPRNRKPRAPKPEATA